MSPYISEEKKRKINKKKIRKFSVGQESRDVSVEGHKTETRKKKHGCVPTITKFRGKMKRSSFWKIIIVCYYYSVVYYYKVMWLRARIVVPRKQGLAAGPYWWFLPCACGLFGVGREYRAGGAVQEFVCSFRGTAIL